MKNKINQNKIDVIIPVYNGANFIIEAIESVVNQTLPPHKIIVVDDGSTDNTYATVYLYSKTSKIEINIVKKENGGLSSARNAGISASTADFIAFLDADDVWFKEKLEKQMRVFTSSNFKNLGLVYCKYDLIKIDGQKDSKNYIVPLDKKIKGSVFNKILESNKILASGSGVLIKRGVFNTVGNFDETLNFCEDWDMWIRITEKFEIDYSNEILVSIRRHGKNMSHNLLNVFIGEIQFYNKWVPKIKGQYPIPFEWSDRIIFRIIKLHKGNLLAKLKLEIKKDVYQELFTKKFGSIYLYFIFFIIRRTIKTIANPSNLLKLVR